ncbi:SMG7L [Olea europaea subsp. europaea]|uniref:SMG7L n=1 Tax=Olea europaea subsp. europaea TaxID=158383 RepID=A0A8S0V761_OLEEU|nr:SMG7L [Olea europaea subsp. europaea]
MNVDSSSTREDQRASENSFIVNTEKQLLALIYSKGLLHSDVLELYHKVRASYEEIILSDSDLRELKEAEYLLWKLHYVHIDEFRKRIWQNAKRDAHNDSINPQTNIEKHLEGFRTFLSEVTEFYRNLIIKLRTNCGFPAEVFMDNKGGSSFSTEPTKLHKCQYTCHRLLVCLGDLARYTEIFKKPDACKWSIAASYYIEATRTWPDSGNPHNQLALLATYVGDAFLALYHCIRSLAVQEPFPDSWNNLMLLFEENRVSHLHSLSSEVHFDFSNPSTRISLQNKSHADRVSTYNINLEDLENVSAAKFNLWPMFIRMISLFLMRSSLQEFSSTLASMMITLEALLALDDAELNAALESYRHMDSTRKGPYRAIQLVCILIFTFQSLAESSERKERTERDNNQLSAQAPLALTFMFICMGRLSERCLKGNYLKICPLLPAVLVFVEWLVGTINRVVAYVADERVMNAVSYFFSSLADLLNRFDENEREIVPDYTALWEDHELRGFYPITRAQALLNFTTRSECMEDFENKNLLRSWRMLHSARIIVDCLNGSQNWIFYDKVKCKFYTGKTMKKFDQGGSCPEITEPYEQTTRSIEDEEPLSGKSQDHPSLNTHTATTEEEEVILFKPITRHNSAPLYISNAKNDQVCHEGKEIQTTTPDEFLRRGTSLCIAQNPPENDSFSFCPITSDSEPSRPFKQQEPQLKDSTGHPPGPPSLSAWFFSRESSNTEEKGLKDITKHKLSPIEEIASTSFSNISIDETKDYEDALVQISASTSSSPYVTPLPSAPVLPDDALWFRENLSNFPELKPEGGNKSDGILGAAPTLGFPSQSVIGPHIGFRPGVHGLVDGCPPLLGMSSSEWLYHYRNSQNLESAKNLISPVHSNAPAYGSFYTNDISTFDVYDQWGNRFVSNPTVYSNNPQPYLNSSLVYGAEGQRRDKLFLGYQRSFPYVCGVGVGMELRTEQQPLLQYLKQREWQLQPDSQIKGPTFIG